MQIQILVTGVAGFIGFHLGQALLKSGFSVVGIDNLNNYYDVSLKKARLAQLESSDDFIFYEKDIGDLESINAIFKSHAPQYVVHLAAQAGVRYSLSHPHLYVQSNIVGFTNIIEACRHHRVEHLIYASTSSVYGANSNLPYKESDTVDQPLTIYAASKKANELIAHSYAHLYQLPSTGLRFFTVYGPWGRPDMAFFSFTRQILKGLPIQVYNYGEMQRDFTYIDDIVNGILLVVNKKANAQEPYKLYNIGRGSPVPLLDYIGSLEEALGKKAIKELLPMQDGDVLATHADISALERDTGYKPSVSYQEGIRHFVDWYQTFYPAE